MRIVDVLFGERPVVDERQHIAANPVVGGEDCVAFVVAEVDDVEQFAVRIHFGERLVARQLSSLDLDYVHYLQSVICGKRFQTRCFG